MDIYDVIAFRLYILLMEPTKKQAFKSMFKSSLGNSYFNGFQTNKFTQKSKLETEKIAEEEEVDENTFRIIQGFAKPDDSYAVYEMRGMFYLQEEGFFSCLSSRKRYQVQIKNFKIKVSLQQNTKQYFNLQTENVSASSKGSHFLLQVEGSQKQFYFEPVDQQKGHIVDDWVSLINKVANSSDGKKYKFNYLPQKDVGFYLQEHISNEEFLKSANSLDIVLFRSPHSAAAVQRVFTNSEYDHVGVVLRNKKNQIFVFESTSNEGVGLTSWKDMIRYEWYKSTEKITWRRLNIVLSPKDVQTIEGFVAKHLGKDFEITLDKLFSFKSSLGKSEEQDKNRSFFCSELVARLYKELGLLDEKKSSTSYFPVDFTEKGGMKFLRDKTYLEPERVLSFNFKK